MKIHFERKIMKALYTFFLIALSLPSYSNSFYLECDLKEKNKSFLKHYYHVNIEKNEFRQINDSKLKYVMKVQELWIRAISKDEKFKIEVSINRLNLNYSWYFDEYKKNKWEPSSTGSGSCKKSEKLKI